MFALFRDGFFKDYLVLLLVTVLVGTALAWGGAAGADAVFGDAVSGLLGDFGQYDVIVHLREQEADAGRDELKLVLGESLFGARVREGVTVAGNANFFVAIPEELRTQEVLEGFRDLVAGVPGENGLTWIIEPSVVVSGVRPGIRERLVEEIQALDEVQLAFRHGSGMTALVADVSAVPGVTNAVQDILDAYQVIEVRFPTGTTDGEPGPERDVLAALRQELDPRVLQDMTMGAETEETASFIKALTEMRRFLMHYASTARLLTPEETGNQEAATAGVSLRRGDQIALRGDGSAPLQPGEALPAGSVVVEVTRVEDAIPHGLIVQGDISQVYQASDAEPPGDDEQPAGDDLDAADDLQPAIDGLEPGTVVQTGYLLDGTTVGAEVGLVAVSNQRYQLGQAVDESLALLDELDGLALEAGAAVDNAAGAIEAFQAALVRMEELYVQVENLQASLSEGAGSRATTEVLATILAGVLTQALFNGDSVETRRGDGGHQAQGGFALENLADLDVQDMHGNLQDLASRISNMQAVDTTTIKDEIRGVRDSLPQLRDEEISSSIQLIDRYIAGRVIPADRLELLVDRGVAADDVERVAREATGVYAVAYAGVAGVVNPNARASLLQVLTEVRRTIAGILAVGFVVLVLVLDHATVLSAMRSLTRITARAGPDSQWHRWLRVLADPARVAGMVVGMFLLGSIYLASGAGFPYVTALHILLVGGILGYLGGALAHRLSPMADEEILAGEALGLTRSQIMREIVVPAGRPGIMSLSNRWRRQFPGSDTRAD